MRYPTSIYNLSLIVFALFMFCGCGNGNNNAGTVTDNTIKKYAGVKSIPDSTLKNEEIPVLCYHQIRNWKSNDSKYARVYIVSLEKFKEQMKALHDSNYNYILPDQLIAYLQNKEKLPSKPIMITFDDADASQYTNALPELNKNSFKGVFFIMTVVLGHNNYMSSDEVKDLATHGHIIGCHTWNHKSVTKYTEEDWAVQIEKPIRKLESITSMPIKYFAYPNGLWDNNAVERIKKYGFTAAFRLWGKYDTQDQLFKIRRIIVDGNWNTTQFLKAINKDPLKNKVPA